MKYIKRILYITLSPFMILLLILFIIIVPLLDCPLFIIYGKDWEKRIPYRHVRWIDSFFTWFTELEDA